MFANLEVSVSSLDASSNTSLVELEANNTFEQGIKDARVWVFLMDDGGKVVGNKAQWIIGGDSAAKEPLQPEKAQSFKLTVDTQSKPTTAKVTFSRIILADGTIADPQKSVTTKGKGVDGMQ
ncbi:MAG: hypothetical protein AAF065_10375 [Verrucomicrobiota bacterium]